MIIGFLIWIFSVFSALIMWVVHDTSVNMNLEVILFTCLCPIYNTLYVITRFPRFCKELKDSNFWKQLKDM